VDSQAAGAPLPPARLARIHEHFRERFECTPQCLAVIDRSGRLIFANRPFWELIGESDDPPPAERNLLALVHPYDRAACHHWLAEAAPKKLRLLLTHPLHQPTAVEANALTLPDPESHGLLVTEFVDQSHLAQEDVARREGAELLQLFSQHAPCGVFITDAAGRLRYCNRRWQSIADLRHVTEPRGVWWQMVHPGDRDRILAQWQGAQLGGHEFTAEYRVNSPGADLRWVRTRIAHSWHPDGRIASCIGVTEDITRQRQADEVLRQSQEQLEVLVRQRTEALQQTNRELADLVYAVTHDLKAPLRGIARLADWLAEDHATQLGDAGQSLVGKLQSRVRKLHSLIDGILAYSRVGHGGEPETQVDLHRLIGELQRLVDPPPHFQIRVPETLPTLPGLPHQLHQLFLNLIDNAIKFMDKPEGHLQITARRLGDGWEFSVADNGPGIPARFHEKVFSLFQRLELQPDRPGAGVGLALVKRIIERRGGDIQIASEEGLGTTFRFTWPDQPRLRPV
jgi:signal transduction histidine kinase